MFDRYSEAARQVIFVARFEAGKVGSKVIDTEHVLLGLVGVDPETLQRIALPVSAAGVRARAAAWRTPSKALPASMDLAVSHDARRSLKQAASLSLTYGCDYVRTEHLLLALLTGGVTHGGTILEEASASVQELEKIVSGLPPAEVQKRRLLSLADMPGLMAPEQENEGGR